MEIEVVDPVVPGPLEHFGEGESFAQAEGDSHRSDAPGECAPGPSSWQVVVAGGRRPARRCYEPGTGVSTETTDGTVVVALTRGVLDRSRRGPFDRATMKVAGEMKDVPGLVGFSFRRQLLGKVVWTMSVWEDEGALRRFIRSPIHRDAMREGSPATEEFLFHSLRVPATAIPIPWSRARALVLDEGEAYPDYGG